MEELRKACSGLVENAGELLREYRFVNLPAEIPPWTESGLELESGDRVTTLARGKVYRAGAPEIRFSPAAQLWFRIGESGQIFRGTRDTNTFEAGSAGKFYLGSHFRGKWADRTGRLATPVELYRDAAGAFTILVLRWRRGVEPLAALRALAAKGDPLGLPGAEVDRLMSFVAPPAGWNYLWSTGPAEIFRRAGGQADHIECRTHGDGGILQKDAGFALGPRTRLKWAWKVDALPSERAENDAAVHDYMSIAVEFDNGQDLTYYWSAALEPETSYRCPLRAWAGRETHVVVRSGQRGLGEWLDEERNVYRDYRAAVGGRMPARIVRVWLIAASLFQRREGRCEFADITLDDGTDSFRVA